MRKRMLTVHANPYAHIDANGRLAGATPIAEPVRPTSVPPTREYVGATRVLVEYDKAGRGPGSPVQPRAEYAWKWTGEGLEVPATGPLGAYYAQRIKDGELLAGEGRDGKGLPLAGLAKARAAALAQFKAEQGEDADTTDWAEQFPLDLQAEAALDIVAEQEKAAADKAKAKADADAARAKATAEKTSTDRAGSLQKARAEAKEAARKALGVKTTAAPPSNADAAPDAGPGVPEALAKAVSGRKENDR